MTDHDEPEHRAYHQAAPDDVALRELGDEDDGMFSVRMPLASTGEVRNEGDEPLTREELDGMRQQIEERAVSVFLDHGSNVEISGSRYSATGKVGEWAAPELVDAERDDGATLLEADARLMDPETLPAASGRLREALAAIKSQVERDLSLASSIGWRDDDSMAGGVDLMEASIVGIPADPRTTSQDAAVAMARAAHDARGGDVDPEALVQQFRAVVMGPANGREADDTVTDDDTPPDEQSEDTADEQAEQRDAPEWAERLLEIQEQQMEVLDAVADAVQEDGMDDEDEDDEDDGEENEGAHGDDEGEEDEQAAEPDAEQTIAVDGEELTADDVAALREQLDGAEPETGGDDGDDSNEEQRETTDDPLQKYELR